nr:uncharacterized protein LOC111417414 [Onthophagus taurus]
MKFNISLLLTILGVSSIQAASVDTCNKNLSKKDQEVLDACINKLQENLQLLRQSERGLITSRENVSKNDIKVIKLTIGIVQQQEHLIIYILESTKVLEDCVKCGLLQQAIKKLTCCLESADGLIQILKTKLGSELVDKVMNDKMPTLVQNSKGVIQDLTGLLDCNATKN